MANLPHCQLYAGQWTKSGEGYNTIKYLGATCDPPLTSEIIISSGSISGTNTWYKP